MAALVAYICLPNGYMYTAQQHTAYKYTSRRLHNACDKSARILGGRRNPNRKYVCGMLFLWLCIWIIPAAIGGSLVLSVYCCCPREKDTAVKHYQANNTVHTCAVGRAGVCVCACVWTARPKVNPSHLRYGVGVVVASASAVSETIYTWCIRLSVRL